MPLMIDFACRVGGHFLSRSVGTELGKIIGADVPDEARCLILGGNLRWLLAPRLEAK